MRSLKLMGIAAVFAASGLGCGVFTTGANAAQVRLDAELGQSAIVGKKTRTIYLRIGLEGVALDEGMRRTPVNVAVVVDRSGSMESENKIGKAREAASMALSRLGAEDIAAVVAYNHEVDVLLPATKLARQGDVQRAIDHLYAGGNTALYAGTEQGLREVMKFADRQRVNRVILISDGLANVGPSEPDEVAVLGRKAAERGVSITTIGLGLGYNEDLMSKLAFASDGNHAFVRDAGDLVEIFNKEFGDVLSVVAQELIIEIECRQGFKPIRVLGRDAEIQGRRITARLNQIYGRQQKYMVVELQVPEDVTAGDLDVADVTVRYASVVGAKDEAISSRVAVKVTDRDDEAEASLNRKVMTDVTTQIATEQNEEAVKLRDQGDTQGAVELLKKNSEYLKEQAGRLSAPDLDALGTENEVQAGNIASGEWNATRKAMRAKQYKDKVQQSY
ncbi:MAG: VWA domain-containing protein [Hyphomicrobiaceae bacterium]